MVQVFVENKIAMTFLENVLIRVVASPELHACGSKKKRPTVTLPAKENERKQVKVKLTAHLSLKKSCQFFFIASKTHTEKKKKLHRINKVIKRKKTNSEFTHLHGNTYKY